MNSTRDLVETFFQNTMLIIAFAGFFLYIRMFIVRNNIKFAEEKEKHIENVVVIEKFESKLMKDIKQQNKIDKAAKEVFCNNKNMKKKCSKFTSKDACTTINCCVWAKSKNGTSCVPGDANGPEMELDGKLAKYDEYYYLIQKKKIL
jgi:hypothetical protein